MNRQLSMEFVRITEQAALKSGRLMGTGDKEGADQAAVDGMHEQFAKTPVSGTVVIGEGEIDEAPMLYIGEHVGAGGEEVDIAVRSEISLFIASATFFRFSVTEALMSIRPFALGPTQIFCIYISGA